MPVPKVSSIALHVAEASPAPNATADVERNDNNEAAAEVRVTTAMAVGLVEAVSVCIDFEISLDAHIALEAIL